MAANTDFVKFDDTLKMVIDVSLEQKEKILNYLNGRQLQKSLFYGAHFSNEALMTCFVRSLSQHVHFIDGGSGGYAMAAKQIKQAQILA